VSADEDNLFCAIEVGVLGLLHDTNWHLLSRTVSTLSQV